MNAIIISTLAVLIGQAAAHGIVTSVTVAGTAYAGYNPNFQFLLTPTQVIGWTVPSDLSLGFVSDYTSSDIICHVGATNAALSAPVNAGDVVELQWTSWPSSHHGPMIDYLANCNGDCATVDKTTLSWFKIDGVGTVDTSTVPASFGDDQMIANNNTWAVRIPEDIASGNYVLRHETIALHQAESVGGAQNYPQCINLQVTGTGTANPSGVLGTSLYVSTDPGLVFNIYTSYTDTAAYTVPGIPLYTGAIAVDNASGALASLNPTVVPAATAAAGGSSAAGGTTAAPATSAAPAPTPSSSTAAAVTSAAAQQCTCGAAPAVTVTSTSVAPTTTSAAAANVCTAAKKKKKVKRDHPREFQA